MERRTCPRCNLNFTSKGENDCYVGTASELEHYWVLSDICPGCDHLVIWVGALENIFVEQKQSRNQHFSLHIVPEDIRVTTVFPRIPPRGPAPPEVPAEFTDDYGEACLILADSAKASAALSRRCLQHILREKASVKHGTLFSEIQEVINSNTLPAHITDILDVPRKLGNVAAHPMKESNSGTIVDVEPWEAEWCLEVIEALYDHYFVMPARNAERLRRLNQKK